MEHQTGSFRGRGGLPIFYQCWRPRGCPAAPGPAEPGSADRPPAPVVVAHGLSEHSGRYAHLAAYLVERGHPVWALDHRGHGRSGGVRVYVDRFEDYLADLDRFLRIVQGAEGRAPVLVGHSMGGLIALAYGLTRPEGLAGLVLSSPWLGLRLRPPLPLRLLVPVLSRLAPRLPVPNEGLLQYVCRDPELLRQYAADPLRARTATPRWFEEALRAQRWVVRRAAELRVPVLFLVAGDDRLVDVETTYRVYQSLPGPKQWRLYPEMYHEVFNDPDRHRVFADLHRWLVEQGLGN
ncbi:MAG: lysophospholipase [Firmicutes bacterium]|nr:lysophospholipase [Bacillota bacterium]